MGALGYYLLAVNGIGFILYLINMWLYTYTAEGQVDKFLTITSLAGGSVGILLAILLFDRKAEKGNMMSRVFIACIFVIQVIIFLMVKGHHADNITFVFGNSLLITRYCLSILGLSILWHLLCLRLIRLMQQNIDRESE